jgi:hypothetical protein
MGIKMKTIQARTGKYQIGSILISWRIKAGHD